MDRSTITVRQEVKDRLALAKGDKSWDDFLDEVAKERLDDAIALAERRLAELRAHKAQAASLAELEQDVEQLGRTKHDKAQPRSGRRNPVGRQNPSAGAAGNSRSRRERGAAGP